MTEDPIAAYFRRIHDVPLPQTQVECDALVARLEAQNAEMKREMDALDGALAKLHEWCPLPTFDGPAMMPPPICPECEGEGAIPPDYVEPCCACDGTGEKR